MQRHQRGLASTDPRFLRAIDPPPGKTGTLGRGLGQFIANSVQL
jgi:hypothetical protein